MCDFATPRLQIRITTETQPQQFAPKLSRLARNGAFMTISVVIPALNEEGNIGRLIDEIFAVVPPDALGEVIAVDDGSNDGTAAEIKALLKTHPRLRYLRHGDRAGQSAALRTGVRAARFPMIATMDGDGQNDPADIMKLYALLGDRGREPAMAAGIRASRKGSGSRKAASRFANFIRDRVLADGCPDTGCGIKLFHREAFLALPYFVGMHRYLPALVLSYGHEIAYEAVNDRPRLKGASKYTNLGRAMIGLYDLVGVSWLRRRTQIPPIAEDISGNAQDAAGARKRAQASPPMV
jgi:dolichol-phosphate mannosyltransferase